MAEIHTQDQSLLRMAKVDLGSDAFLKDYHAYRETYSAMGHRGMLPLAVLVEIGRRHGAGEVAEALPPPVPVPASKPAVKQNGKAK